MSLLRAPDCPAFLHCAGGRESSGQAHPSESSKLWPPTEQTVGGRACFPPCLWAPQGCALGSAGRVALPSLQLLLGNLSYSDRGAKPAGTAAGGRLSGSSPARNSSCLPGLRSFMTVPDCWDFPPSSFSSQWEFPSHLTSKFTPLWSPGHLITRC